MTYFAGYMIESYGLDEANTALGLALMGVAQEVFEANDIPFTPQLVYDANETPENLYQRGVKRREELMGSQQEMRLDQSLRRNGSLPD